MPPKVIHEPELLTGKDRLPPKLDPGVEFLAKWLDSAFQIPGTSWRVGLDPIIGLFPWVGDTVSSLAGLYILVVALQREVPKATMLRMGANIALDYVVGAIPVAGDLFDVYWKSNQRNVALLRRHVEASPVQSAKVRRADWIWLAALVSGLVALLLLSMLGAFWLFTMMWHQLMTAVR